MSVDPQVERLWRNLEVVASASAAPSRRRAAVVGWDLTHNPVGRAHVIYRLLAAGWDVDLVGPMFRQFGTSLWAPVAGESLNVRSFRAESAADFVPAAIAVACRQRYELVVCGKHRLPSVFLATLLAEASNAPMVIDIDDDEMAFAELEDPTRPPRAMHSLLDTGAAELAERSIVLADGVTVASRLLQDRFGGVVVRHARPVGPRCGTPRYAWTRRASRSRCGIGDGEVALFFIGTVREHKGVQDIVAALAAIGRGDIRLHVFTTTPDDAVRSIIESVTADGQDLYVLHGPCELEEIPTLLAGADLVVLPQHADSPISRFQVPAKISDAASMGCRVLVPDLPVFADLAACGLVETYPLDGLVTAIKALVTEPFTGDDALELQDRFRSELGIEVNRGRLAEAVDAATSRFEDEPRRSSAALHDAVVDRYRRAAPARVTALPRSRQGDGPRYDTVFFWKQNDSDLYGRRSDMIVKHAVQQGRTGTAIHFDGAIGCDKLHLNLTSVNDDLPRQGDHDLANVIERHLGWRDDAALRRRCFVHSGEARDMMLLGRPLATRSNYGQWVCSELDAAGLDAATTVAWLWPIVPELEVILERVSFGLVVCDLVDDQRKWPNLSDAEIERIEAGYRTAIEVADLVITNSKRNAEAFVDFGKPIHVIPNGADPRPKPLPPPPALDPPLGAPLIGYVGNMRDRVRWDVFETVAQRHPEWTLALVGEVPFDSPARTLAQRHPNIRLTGILPYEQARSLMGAFDVALVPHTLGDLGAQMDPLKLYNYLAMGIPVVSTSHPTALEFAETVSIADTPDGFCDHIERLLSQPRPAPPIDVTPFSWAHRVETIYTLIDALPDAPRLHRTQATMNDPPRRHPKPPSTTRRRRSEVTAPPPIP